MGEEMEERICEPIQGKILREDDESNKEEERTDECLTKWMESVELEHREMKGKETEESNGFETKNLCVNAGYAGWEDEHLP